MHTACTESLRTLSMKIMVIYGGWVGKGFLCRWFLRTRVEGFHDTVLGVCSSAHGECIDLGASLVVNGLSSGSGTGVR